MVEVVQLLFPCCGNVLMWHMMEGYGSCNCGLDGYTGRILVSGSSLLEWSLTNVWKIYWHEFLILSICQMFLVDLWILLTFAKKIISAIFPILCHFFVNSIIYFFQASNFYFMYWVIICYFFFCYHLLLRFVTFCLSVNLMLLLFAMIIFCCIYSNCNVFGVLMALCFMGTFPPIVHVFFHYPYKIKNFLISMNNSFLTKRGHCLLEHWIHCALL